MLFNGHGQDIIGGITTTATFVGAPLVALGSVGTFASNVNNPKWDALAALTSSSGVLAGAPLVAVDTGESVAALDAGLRRYAAFFDSTRLRPFTWSDGRDTLAPALCGPVLAFQATDEDLATQRAAWDLSARYARTTQQHLYKRGMLAIGAEVRPGLFSPPVYKIGASTWRADLGVIVKLWLEGGTATEAQVTLLANIDAGVAPFSARPGIARRVAPYLLPYLVPYRP